MLRCCFYTGEETLIKNTTAMKNEILELEKQYWAAMAAHDLNTVTKLTHFPCILTAKNGVREVDEKAFQEGFEQAKEMEMKIVGITDEKVQMLSDDYGIIGYTVEIEHVVKAETTRSKAACSSAWIKEEGEWKCALHTETEINP